MIKQVVPGLVAVLLAASASHAADEQASKQATTSGGSQALHQAMTKGMQDMRTMKMAGDTDKDFATMMIHHHQQAIDMARIELKNGKDAEVRRKAQEIIDTSEKDIAELKKWQNDHHAASR